MVEAAADTSVPVAEPVSEMDYSSFVGLIRERNRPSGGVRTVQEVAVQARIGSDSRVLEIGSNTGFTSVNISLLTGASVVGIDVNPNSVAEAESYAQLHGLSDQVQFQVQDARELAVEDASFDAVWVSNVVSFVSDKARMLDEVTRVVKVGGTVIAVPIYYRRRPPQKIVDQVSEAIGTPVDVMSKNDWRAFYEKAPGLELYYESDFVYDLIDDQDVERYCDGLMEKEHLAALDPGVQAQIRDRMGYFMRLFNENLSYAGFSVMLLQKRVERDEVELFTSHSVPLLPKE
ncbi:class I SAM-dependent methyltransferase [Streptomyces griseiscabiei]|uniref:Class I SAM-dependent methyltransferase n=1 Tax=Streptomyces griseiscabiei TaxID=2993540 RepID=A0ABU4L8Y8_9ACTN|nr:class I SAM-dependent methyltransferase [Streptomyces griseiscabiei]MBZ3906998.1 class I SAM-dependent methyltransferase [Streptomyces griseiscabiei]MDX2911619.1 class I SAM-dependent methyltransferase [Streptomyces griseiscabiei]